MKEIGILEELTRTDPDDRYVCTDACINGITTDL